MTADSSLGGDPVERALWALQAYDTTALATVGHRGPHVAGVFYAPERHAGGIRLITAMLRDSRKHRDILADPRVAFLCSPGRPSRWLQGHGHAVTVEDEAERPALFARLVEHAPGARSYTDGLPVLPVLIEVVFLSIVEGLASPAVDIDLTVAGRARS